MYAKPTDRVGIIGIGGLGHLGQIRRGLWLRRGGVHLKREQVQWSQGVWGQSSGVEQGLRGDQETRRQLWSADQHRERKARVGRDYWNDRAERPAARGRCGAVLEPIPVAVFSLILQQRSVSGSPAGSPTSIERMLNFASWHNVAPQTEHFPMSHINDAFARLESGKARYRIVLDADFDPDWCGPPSAENLAVYLPNARSALRRDLRALTPDDSVQLVVLPLWTEIPLLANNIFKCAPAIRRPPQNELLCTPNFVFLKNKGYAFEPLRVIEDQTNRLLPRSCHPQASRIFGTEGRLDRKVLVLRRGLDRGSTLEVYRTQTPERGVDSSYAKAPHYPWLPIC
jgi:hypothetical protein